MKSDKNITNPTPFFFSMDIPLELIKLFTELKCQPPMSISHLRNISECESHRDRAIKAFNSNGCKTFSNIDELLDYLKNKQSKAEESMTDKKCNCNDDCDYSSSCESCNNGNLNNNIKSETECHCESDNESFNQNNILSSIKSIFKKSNKKSSKKIIKEITKYIDIKFEEMNSNQEKMIGELQDKLADQLHGEMSYLQTMLSCYITEAIKTVSENNKCECKSNSKETVSTDTPKITKEDSKESKQEKTDKTTSKTKTSDDSKKEESKGKGKKTKTQTPKK